jgi:4-cresol dehydrogenase (hydroxylating)
MSQATISQPRRVRATRAPRDACSARAETRPDVTLGTRSTLFAAGAGVDTVGRAHDNRPMVVRVADADTLRGALTAWATALGAAHVQADERTLAELGRATFRTKHGVAGVIRPSDRASVQECVRIANRFRIPIYPISRGTNWGYGSRVPPAAGCVVMDLGRMNRILDFDEDLAFIRVEPGVTFAQVAEHLESRGSSLMLNVTGGSPEGSLIGNAVERGLGFGLYRDRVSATCAMEVVLPTGECLHTGFDRFEGAVAAPLHRWGIGPSLDGLFVQSNLGIVTALTAWLHPKPAELVGFWFDVVGHDELAPTLDALRPFAFDPRFDVRLSNDLRMATMAGQYPWRASDDRTPMPEHLRRGAKWRGYGVIHCDSKEEARARRAALEAALRGKARGLVFRGSAWRKLGDALRELGSVGRYVARVTGPGSASVWLGTPNDISIRSIYWRKRSPAPPSPDPDRDGCGLLWCCPVLPHVGKGVRDAVDTLAEITRAHGFEPIVNLRPMDGRFVEAISAIYYDRDAPGDDDRALDCVDAIMKSMQARGLFPYRVPHPWMDALPPPRDDYGRALQMLKRTLDPNDVLAPGRYDFRSTWPSD